MRIRSALRPRLRGVLTLLSLIGGLLATMYRARCHARALSCMHAHIHGTKALAAWRPNMSMCLAEHVVVMWVLLFLPCMVIRCSVAGIKSPAQPQRAEQQCAELRWQQGCSRYTTHGCEQASLVAWHLTAQCKATNKCDTVLGHVPNGGCLCGLWSCTSSSCCMEFTCITQTRHYLTTTYQSHRSMHAQISFIYVLACVKCPMRQARDGQCGEGRVRGSNELRPLLELPVVCDLGTDCGDCGPWVGPRPASPSWCAVLCML